MIRHETINLIKITANNLIFNNNDPKQISHRGLGTTASSSTVSSDRTTSFTHALIHSYSSTIHQFISGEWSQRKRLELSICLMRFVWRGWGREKDRHPHTVLTGRNSPWNEASFSLSVQSVCVTPSEMGKWVDTCLNIAYFSI